MAKSSNFFKKRLGAFTSSLQFIPPGYFHFEEWQSEIDKRAKRDPIVISRQSYNRNNSENLSESEWCEKHLGNKNNVIDIVLDDTNSLINYIDTNNIRANINEFRLPKDNSDILIINCRINSVRIEEGRWGFFQNCFINKLSIGPNNSQVLLYNTWIGRLHLNGPITGRLLISKGGILNIFESQ